MEKQKGKAGYYVLSVVPLLATLMIQVLSGLTCSVIGTVVYSVRIAMNGEAELLNDSAALQAAVTDYIMQFIIYAVVVAQILTLIGAAVWYGILVKRKNVNRSIKECVNVRTVLMCILAGIGLQLVIDFLLNIAALAFPNAMEAYSQLVETVGIGETTWISLLATVILAPISEELLFRGLTLRFLRSAGVKFCSSKCNSGIVFWNFTYESGTGDLCFCSGTGFRICCRKVQNGFPADSVTSVFQYCRNSPCSVVIRKYGMAYAGYPYGCRCSDADRCISACSERNEKLIGINFIGLH